MTIQVDSTTDTAETIASVMGAKAGAPEVEQKQAAPENTNAEQEDGQGESTDESAASEQGKEGETHKRKGGFQKRIDKLTRRQAELESQNAALLEALRQSGKAPDNKPAEENKAPVSEGKPKPEDFENHDEFVEALTDWKVEQKLNTSQKKVQEQQAREEQNRQQTEFQTRMDSARERYEDFDDVMGESEVPVTPAMSEIIMTSEVGPDIAYYLANNPEEAGKIAKMPALAAAKALGKLEDKLEAQLKASGQSEQSKGEQKPAQESKKTETPVTKAPKPITPVNAGGASGGSAKDPEKMSYQEFKKWRESGGGRA